MGPLKQYIVDAFAGHNDSLDSVCRELASKWSSPNFATYFLIITKKDYTYARRLSCALNYRECSINEDYLIIIVDEWQKDEGSVKAKPESCAWIKEYLEK